MRGATRGGPYAASPSNRSQFSPCPRADTALRRTRVAVVTSRIFTLCGHAWPRYHVLPASPSSTSTVEAAALKGRHTRRPLSTRSNPAAAADSSTEPSISPPQPSSSPRQGKTQPLDQPQSSGDRGTEAPQVQMYLWLLSGPGLDPPGLSFELPTRGLKKATDHAARELESRGVQLPPVVPGPGGKHVPRPLPEGYSLSPLLRRSFTAGILCGQPREIPEGWTLESLLALPLAEREAVWERSQPPDPAAMLSEAVRADPAAASGSNRTWVQGRSYNWLLTGPGLEPLGVALHVEKRNRTSAVQAAKQELANRGMLLPSPSPPPGRGKGAEEEGDAQLLQLGYSLQQISSDSLTLRVLRGKSVKLPDGWTLEALLALPLEQREATYQQIRPRRSPPGETRWRLTGPKLGRDGVVITLTESYTRRWFFAQLEALRELADRGVLLSAAAEAVLEDGSWPATEGACSRSYLPDRYKLFPIDDNGEALPQEDRHSKAQKAASERRLAQGLPAIPLGFTAELFLALPEDERERVMRITNQKRGASKRAMKKGVPTTSRFVGVSWEKSRQRWHAWTMVNGKSHSLGRYLSETEAARAYDMARVEAHNEGLSATDIDKLNFPEEWREDFEGEVVRVGGIVVWRQIVRR